MSERNQGKNNEYDNGDLHTVCACGDDPASDPAFPVSEGRGRNFDARTENGHPSDTAYGSAAVAVKSYFHKVSESVFGSDSGIWGGIPKSTCRKLCRRSQTRYIRVWDLLKTVLTSSTSVSRSQSDWSVRDI